MTLTASLSNCPSFLSMIYIVNAANLLLLNDLSSGTKLYAIPGTKMVYIKEIFKVRLLGPFLI